MNKSKLTYKTIETTPKEKSLFDLESWLADLLVEYWLAQQEDKKKGCNYDAQ